MLNVSPHIVVPDADAASAWYAEAFGGREISRVPLRGGRAMSVEMRIGESVIHVGSEFPDAGILSPLYGHRWNIAQKLRDVPPEEIAAAAAEIFGKS